MGAEKLKALIKSKNTKITDLQARAEVSESVEELRGIDADIKDIAKEVEELRGMYSEFTGESLNNESWQINEGKRSQENDAKEFKALSTYSQGDNAGSPEKRNEDHKDNYLGDIALRSKDSLERSLNIPSNKSNLDIGKYVRGMVTGNWENAENEKRAMVTSGTGVIIPQVLSARIIDVARTQSLFAKAEVPIIPMTSNNESIARLKSGPIFKFKEEGKTTEESKFELESIKLQSKTCYGYAYVSLEAIQSSKNLRDIIINSFSKAISEAIDNGMLYGQYNGTTYDKFAPSGIMKDEEINVIEAKAGDNYDVFIKALGKVRKANGTPTVYGVNSETEELLSLTKDSTGQYLDEPKAISKLMQVVSNQLKSDETTGSDGIVFDPNAMIIGIQNNVSIQMFDTSDECIQKGLVGFRIYSMLDCVVTQPKHICKITGIK